MPFNEFWDHVRMGAGLVAPPHTIADSPRLNATQIESLLHQTDSWLTPKAVHGYNPADITFLPPEQQQRLTNAVNQFQQVARQIKPRQPATQRQRDDALPHFCSIVELLEFDRFADAEAYRVGKTIETDPRFPTGDIIDIRYRTKTDSSGEPSLKMMAYLPDTDEPTFLTNAFRVRNELQDLVFELGQPYWPYVSGRLFSDLADLAKHGVEE